MLVERRDLVGNLLDGKPSAVKVACSVWGGGKVGDNIKDLPITIGLDGSTM
ncbi:hypothetical protein [Bacillus sp. AFS040349]|uniref:hypothetical protein n=1 Tax=Bacillus sp. AFS040349 TaxID=2033502 RepID=UPI00159BA467|nr:hypothetical protein [Bacillus sp. AFS040349]